MDPVNLVQMLTATLSMDAAERTNAEARLNEVKKMCHVLTANRVSRRRKNKIGAIEFHCAETELRLLLLSPKMIEIERIRAK